MVNCSSCLIRLQDSLISNISERNQLMYWFFMHRMNHRENLRLSLLVGCGQVCLTSNQITLFFEQQYYWTEPINIFDFLHGDNHLSLQLLFGCGQMCLCSKRIPWIINISGRNQLISLLDHCHFIFLFYIFACIYQT